MNYQTETVAYKEILSRRTIVDERNLHISGDIHRMIGQQAMLAFDAVCKVLKRVEFEEFGETKEYAYVPLTWFDHLKMTLLDRWPRLWLSWSAERTTLKATYSLQISRMCPHHSSIASNRHCERFITREVDFSFPRFDPLEPDCVIPVYHEMEERGQKPYTIEVSKSIRRLADDIMRAQSYGQGVSDFLANASESDIAAWRFPMIISLWEFFNHASFPIQQTPEDYMGSFKLFGLPVKVNPNLPDGSWRIL